MSGKARRRVAGTLPRMTRWALAVAVGGTLAVGILVAPGLGRIASVLPLPSQAPPAWGEAWGSTVTTVNELAAAALSDRVRVAAAALSALGILALFTALLRLLGEREAVRPGLAVRWATGASPRGLARWLLSRGRGGMVRSLLVGAGLGVLAAAVLWASWPVDGHGARPSVLLPLLALALVVPVALALASPAFGIEGRGPALLRTGRGSTDDPRAGTVRRAAATLQMAAAFSLVLTGATLGADRVGPTSGEAGVDGDTLLVPLRPLVAGVDWGSVQRALGSTAAESLSTPGAWTGQGVQDLVTVQCGNCSNGGLPLPIYGVRATIHAVSPGFIQRAGLTVVEGRGFGAGDDAEAPPVALVSTPFARAHFENGEPLGHKILLGGGGDRWVTVVGVVDPLPFQAPGGADPGAPVLYLPLAQHEASEVVWAVPPVEGTAEVPEVPSELAVATAPDRAATVRQVRSQVRAPLRWTGRVLLFAGLLGLVLALVGAGEASAAEVRGRWREAAVRSAVGARPVKLAIRLMRRTAGTAVAGSLMGWVLAWSFTSAAGSGVPLRSSWAVTLGGLLLAASLAGAAGPARRAAGSDPAVLLREDV